VVLDGAACVHLHGKGRKQRTMPLWRSTVKAVRAWLRFNPHLQPTSALLPNRDGQAMTRTNVAQRLALAVKAATAAHAAACDAPHLPAHHPPHDGHAPAAVRRGHRVIALWLGHESPTTTHQYVEADLAMKEKALARLQEPDAAIRRFRASDSLLEFLKGL
jgi:integrase/recombinase XerD